MTHKKDFDINEETINQAPLTGNTQKPTDLTPIPVNEILKPPLGQ